MSSAALVGKLGTVTTRVRGGDKAGEVRVVVEGVPHFYLGFAPTEIAVGTQVLIIGLRGARQIVVEPWTQPDLTAPPTPS